MSTCFNIEESYKRFCGDFYDLSKEKIMNPNELIFMLNHDEIINEDTKLKILNK